MGINFTGLWIANLAKSRFVGPTPQAVSARIDHGESSLDEEIVTTNPDGSQVRALFHCSIDDRHDTCLLNGKVIRGGARWQAGQLLIESWIRVDDHDMHFCDYWSLSPDGQTLSMAHRNDDLAGQFTVLERARDPSRALINSGPSISSPPAPHTV